MCRVWVTRDAVQLARVDVVGHGRHVHHDVTLPGRLRLVLGILASDVRVAVAHDDRDVVHAGAISSSGRVDVVVGHSDRLLRVGFSAGGPEAEGVQDALLASVRVQVEFDPCVGRVADERDACAVGADRKSVDDVLDEVDAAVVDGVHAAGHVQNEGHVHLLRAICRKNVVCVNKRP